MNASGPSLTAESQVALASALDCLGSKPLAHIHDSLRATDFAIALRPPHLAVVRCVARSSAEDRAALATMIADGDFAWAALIHSSDDTATPEAPVRSFHISEMTGLIAALRSLGAGRS